MKRTLVYSAGVQNESPQGVPHWYTDDFELRAVLASGSRETFVPPFNYLEELELEALLLRAY